MQATYQITRRSSVTASGSYGILHYTDSGNIDTHSVFGSLGFNYKATKKDTVGFFYQIATYHFPGSPEAFGTQTVSAAYARKITGRLALSLYGGPQFTSSRIPFNTTSTGTTLTGTTSTGPTSMTNGYASAFLNYALTNGGVSARYIHGVSGGSGVLTGSLLDEVGVSGSRRLTRQWHGNINFGYAHNRTLATSSAPTPGGNPSYDSWYAGAGLGRPFGRNFTLFLSYYANIETHNPNCTTPGCGTSATTSSQFVAVNIRWHPRPFAFE